tara:strand:- start:426 stop:659 length:234 start_codon:yes stop_codon:yes gene_type:complete
MDIQKWEYTIVVDKTKSDVSNDKWAVKFAKRCNELGQEHWEFACQLRPGTYLFKKPTDKYGELSDPDFEYDSDEDLR